MLYEMSTPIHNSISTAVEDCVEKLLCLLIEWELKGYLGWYIAIIFHSFYRHHVGFQFRSTSDHTTQQYCRLSEVYFYIISGFG